jgi:hypothetical protein
MQEINFKMSRLINTNPRDKFLRSEEAMMIETRHAKA